MSLNRKNENGTAALEFAVVALPLFSILSIAVYLCITLITLAQAHREVSFSSTNALAALNSSYLPPSNQWHGFFINHGSGALTNEAINLAQSQYGFSPTTKYHLAAANYAAGSASRNNEAYGLTSSPELGKKQLGIQFTPQWFSVLVKFPGVTGVTLRASTINLTPPGSGGSGSGGSGGSGKGSGDDDTELFSVGKYKPAEVWGNPTAKEH